MWEMISEGNTLPQLVRNSDQCRHAPVSTSFFAGLVTAVYIV